LNGIQITESDGNRWPPPKGRDIGDLGSEFYSLKTEILNSKLGYTSLTARQNPSGDLGRQYRFSGNWHLANAFATVKGGPVANLSFSVSGKQRLFPVVADLSSSRASLVSKGAIAVAACNPGNQIANAASAIGELLQDVPRIPGIALWEARLRALVTLAASGGEFLNVVFGIDPTISDMKAFVSGVHKVDRLVDQFIRDSGRSVRRKFHFPKERSESTDVLSGIYSPIGVTSVAAGADNTLLGFINGSLPVYETKRHRVIERDVWFSGAFTYHLPDWYETGNRSDRIRLSAQLLGAKPDLNTLWQLTPWSWAVDWFSNAGSFVKNLQSLITYGTVLRYGYVMETTTVTDTYSAGDLLANPTAEDAASFSAPYPRPHPVTVRTTVKKRVQANPFGFGVSWDGLSPMQLAISAALGITRVVR